MIRNANRNISVSKGHGYTVEKVKYALDFINSSNRTKTIDDWVKAYNHIKGTNETAQGCQACKAAKFTAAVRNYAQYGYLTLINEGHKPEEFKDEPKVNAETYVEEKKVEELNEETSAILQDTSTETCNEEQQVPELASTVINEDNVEVSEDTVKEVAEQVVKPVVKHNKGGRPRKVKK